MNRFRILSAGLLILAAMTPGSVAAARESLAIVALPNTTIESAAVDPNDAGICRVTELVGRVVNLRPICQIGHSGTPVPELPSPRA